MTKFIIKGKGDINLSQKDLIGSGGEGTVYCKGNVAHKIYNDKSKMISYSKIKELSCLSLSNIIKPMDVILSSSRKNDEIGYSY